MSKHRTHGILWRRWVSGLLCMALLLGLLPQAGLTADAASGEQGWAMPYMEQLVDWGVMRGDINGNLNPDREITRAEFVSLINRAYGYDKLGGTPFTDINYATDWFAEDIDIAYNMGYFHGTSATTASPRSPVTREQAAVFLARNLMLQTNAGESLGFSDSRTLSDWSRGLVAAAAMEGMITGYSDGSFRPRKNITRGEASAMLVRVIGTPINEAGDYTLGDVYGNVTLSSPGVSLRNTTIAGNLYLTGGVDLGDVLLENVNVLGRIVISGAGESNSSQSSVILRNVEADELVVDSISDQFVTIRVEGNTDVPVTYVRTNAYLDDSSIAGFGLKRIELVGERGTLLQLAGNIKEVINRTPGSDLQINQGTAEKVTIDEYATGSTVRVDQGAKVDEMDLDVSTVVSGKGDIKDLNVGASGTVVEILPDQIVIRPGITADIDGTTMDSVTAAEASADPKLLAGYPSVRNIAPKAADGVYSTNKAGTVYWAVSALGDGSVLEEDLISNPAYGGNIFSNQAGSVDAESAKTEYTQAIANLDTDGSYYLSAIMVDDRGKRSPVKVVAFTTPDDSTPAFAAGYPQKTRETTERAQVTVMTTKSCMLYYALLPAGSTAPTAQEFKNGNIPGNWGYGSVDMTKNVTKSINVNGPKLQEKTDYDLFLWLTDYNGAKSSNVTKVTFNIPDETPPVVGEVIQTVFQADSAGATFSINEAPATLYWAIVAEGDTTFIPDTADLTDRRYKIKVESGAGAINSGSAAVRNANVDTLFNITKLAYKDTQTNNFTLWYVGKDAAGNYSEQVQKVEIRTLDTTPPTVTQEFNPMSGDSPLADSSITLVFSENVQDGPDPESASVFRALYDRVKSAADETEAAIARDDMARVLEKCIQLRKIVDGVAEDVKVRKDVDVDAADYVDDGIWTIDWRFAEIEMKGTDRLELRLPSTSSDPNYPNHVAVRMESGVTYYFHTTGIHDTAYKPNALEDKRGSGVYDLPRFRTVYAQVILSSSGDYVSIPANETLAYDDLRLDMYFDVKPTSTSKVPATERWDMIIQTDTTVYMDLYRQEYDADGNLLDVSGNVAAVGDDGNYTTETWEKVNKNGPVLLPANSGRGLGYAILGDSEANGSYGVLREELEEGYTYRYGVHLTQLVSIPEGTNTKIDPPTWTGTVNMTFSLIAGSRSGVRNVSQAVNQYYDPDSTTGMGGNNVSVISQVNTQTGTEKELKLKRQYTDTRVPEFSTGYPEFDTYSGMIEMKLDLTTTEGTIYYVIAPAVDGINTGVDPGNGAGVQKISPINDGTALDDKKTDTEDNINAKKTLIGTRFPNLTYIPLNGWERDWFKEHIAFTSYTGKEATKYTAPFFDNIVNPPAAWQNSNNVYVGDPVKYNGATQTVQITASDTPVIDADTEYYIYFVLQGSANSSPSEVVQCYRVKTKKAQPPIVQMSNTYTSATMNAIDPETGGPYEGSEIYYAIAVMSSSTGSIGTLPAIFNQEYYWGTPLTPVGTNDSEETKKIGPQLTVLNALMRSPDRGKTYFDLYADRAMKNSVLTYVTGSGNNDLGVNPLNQFGPEEGPSKNQDFSQWMTSNSSEYVVLAVAKHRNAADDISSYGFSAARNLYNTDPNPPELVTTTLITNNQNFFQANITGVYETPTSTTNLLYGTDPWGSKPGASGFYFEGSVTLTFSTNLYWAVRGGTVARRAVLAANSTTDADKIAMRELIAPSSNATWEVTGNSTGATNTFTFKFKGLQSGQGFTLSSSAESGLASSNPNSNVCTKTLTLRLDATTTNKDFNPNAIIDTMLVPSFRWTWG